MREIYEDPKTGRYKWREKQPVSEPPVALRRLVRHRLVEYILTRFWMWRLRRIKRLTGTIGFHPYPPDTETGWRKDRKDYLGIKATSRLIQKVKDA